MTAEVIRLDAGWWLWVRRDYSVGPWAEAFAPDIRGPFESRLVARGEAALVAYEELGPHGWVKAFPRNPGPDEGLRARLDPEYVLYRPDEADELLAATLGGLDEWSTWCPACDMPPGSLCSLVEPAHPERRMALEALVDRRHW